MVEYICRDCGSEYKSPTWDSENGASFNICNCCGVEFGIQDSSYKGVIDYRNEWTLNGFQWIYKQFKPIDWNIEEQLKNIPDIWK